MGHALKEHQALSKEKVASRLSQSDIRLRLPVQSQPMPRASCNPHQVTLHWTKVIWKAHLLRDKIHQLQVLADRKATCLQRWSYSIRSQRCIFSIAHLFQVGQRSRNEVHRTKACFRKRHHSRQGRDSSKVRLLVRCQRAKADLAWAINIMSVTSHRVMWK